MKNKYIQQNSWIDKYLDKYHLVYPISFILILTSCFLIIMKIGGLSLINRYVFYILEFIFITFSFNLLLYKAVISEKLEYIYLSLMIPIGLFYLVFLIPNYSYDESAHMFRVYELANGKIITKSNNEKRAIMKVPQQLIDTMQVKNYKELVKNIQLESDYKNDVEISPDGTGAASYTIFSYFSPTLGVIIGKFLNLNLMLTYYLARIFSFIAFLVASFYAIKLIPFGKIVLFIFSFNPIWIQQAISLSADTMINAFTLLLISFIFYLYNKKDKITDKEINVYGLLAISIAFMKMVYFPLSALALILFFKIKNKKHKRKIIIIIALTILFAFINYLISNLYIFPKSYQLKYGIDSMKQLSWIIHYPIKYVKVILSTTLTKGDFYFYTMLGRSLGDFRIALPNIVIIFYSFIIILSPFIEEKKCSLKKYQKIIILVIIAIIYLLVETALYLTWSGVGASTIEGVQGRYFHPILLLTPFVFMNKNSKIIIKNKILKLSVLLLSINVVAIWFIINFFV